jgi:hypothetical protein
MNDAPMFTALDAASQGIAGGVYLAVGVAAWLARPRDARTRVFLGVALASVAAFAVTVAGWYAGTSSTDLSRASVATLLTAFTVGSVVLFHFCQVFPWRRPLIARWGWLLPHLYAGPGVAALGLVLLAPPSVQEIDAVYLVLAAAVGLPLLAAVAIALPIGGILSLVRSYREATGEARRPMRTPLVWILVSQIAGGSIALVFAPVLAIFAPGSTVEAALKIVVGALGVMTPVAFALAVWKYGLPPEEAPSAAAVP